MAEETLKKKGSDYSEENIITLEWYEHIRRRAGMYIGRLGNGDRQGDGIYVLLKEVIDNSVDEFSMGFGKRIDITIDEDQTVTVRDFGRGIPLGSVVDVTSKLNTGGKFDTEGVTATLPGETAAQGKGSIPVTLDTAGLPKGETVVMLTLTTNCPARPLINLFLVGEVR